MQPIKHQPNENGFGRTKPFLFTGKALDFISTMFSIIVFISIFGESLYIVVDKGAVIWSVLAALGFIVVILIGLVFLYIYYGLNGLPVDGNQNNSVKFPPARLKLVDLIIIFSLLALDVAVIGYVFNQYLNDTIYTYSVIQFFIALIAFTLGIIALIMLVKEHWLWKENN